MATGLHGRSLTTISQAITETLTEDGVEYTNISWVRSTDLWPPSHMSDELLEERRWGARAFLRRVDGGWALFVAMEGD